MGRSYPYTYNWTAIVKCSNYREICYSKVPPGSLQAYWSQFRIFLKCLQDAQGHLGGMLGWGGPAPTPTIPYCWIAATTRESAILKCLQDPSRHAGGTLECSKVPPGCPGASWRHVRLGRSCPYTYNWTAISKCSNYREICYSKVPPRSLQACWNQFRFFLKCLQDAQGHLGGMLGWGCPAPIPTIAYCWIAATTRESAILKCLHDPCRHAGGSLEFF